MGSPGSLSFDQIRPWNGSQDRAFEELAYQLLQDEVPEGTKAIRTGNPDGGVEWYASSLTAGEWGWQVKNIRDIESLLSGMTTSVKQVTKERRDLVRLTFVIPKNLNTGTYGNTRISERTKYENKIEAWKGSIPGADRIEFHLVQESHLLAKLALPENQGRQKFWWNRDIFGPEWLRAKFDGQVLVAGPKYRPELQVDLPISRDLLALGLSPSTVKEFASLIRRTLTELEGLGPVGLNDADLLGAWKSMQASADALATKLKSLVPLSEAVTEFDSWQAAVHACLETVAAVEILLSNRAFAIERTSVASTEGSSEMALNRLRYEVASLSSTVAELHGWLISPAGRAARSRLYFIDGPAGSGKTHLLLDAVQVALEEKRPALVLFGSAFGYGDFWQSICSQLGLEPLGGDLLLGAMAAAAEASTTYGGRFVIMIDALNETAVEGFWDIHLPILRAAIASHPQLALAVSCRDTYLEVVAPESEREHFVQGKHPGFAGLEVEAAEKYFRHYELEAPRIPLLIPEFTIPLFLRLYCESLKGKGQIDRAIGHEGRIAIFERFLETKIDLIARGVFSKVGSDYELARNRERVRAVLNALLDGMANADTEWLAQREAEAIASSSLGGNTEIAIQIIGRFENEGVLQRSPLYLVGQGKGTGVRILFQAFSDFLLLGRKLASFVDPLESTAMKAWLLDSASLGVLEAATVTLPETFGIELPDLLDLTPQDLSWEAAQYEADLSKTERARYVYRSLVAMLPYRTAAAIDSRTLDLVNHAWSTVLPDEELFRVLFMSAPQPGSLLNGKGLHNYLTSMKMPARDSSFGFAVYRMLFDESSPVTRLARWATLGPYPDYPNETIELSAIPLCWLLSSPNRIMRDWVTKALVQLLHGHLDVMQKLFESFWSVDDPYVVQRVVAIAYGCVMRGGQANREHARELVKSVRAHVFQRPMRPDELMLDAGRGLVEWAVAHELLPEASLASTKRPYGLKRPGNAPMFKRIKAKYLPKSNQPAGESFASVYEQVFYMGFYDTGNFGRRTVTPDISWFSCSPVGKPKRQSNRTVSRSHRFQDDVYPADRALRWLFMRALSLGWSPQVFGSQDRLIGYRDTGHESSREESWGKKYLWMAFHELLARVADNYQESESVGGLDSYDGLQQMIGTREIDPSLPPIPYNDLHRDSERNTMTWPGSSVHAPKRLAPTLDFSRFHGEIAALLKDSKSEPCPSRLASFAMEGGAPWIPLHGFEEQREHEGLWNERSLVQNTWVRSLLIRRDHEQSAPEVLKGIWREEIRETELSHHVDCCYAGEIGWSLRPCQDRPAEPRTISGHTSSVECWEICERYIWEGNVLDSSLTDSVRATMPSRFVQMRSGIRMVYGGPTWVDSRNEPVAVYQEFDSYRSHALFARVDWLKDLLLQTEMALVLLVQFDRLVSDPNRTKKYARLNGWSAATFDVNGHLRKVGDMLTRKEMW